MGINGLRPIRPEEVSYLLEIYRPTIAALKERFGDRLNIWDKDTEKLEEFSKKNSLSYSFSYDVK